MREKLNIAIGLIGGLKASGYSKPETVTMVYDKIEEVSSGTPDENIELGEEIYDAVDMRFALLTSMN